MVFSIQRIINAHHKLKEGIENTKGIKIEKKLLENLEQQTIGTLASERNHIKRYQAIYDMTPK